MIKKIFFRAVLLCSLLFAIVNNLKAQELEIIKEKDLFGLKIEDKVVLQPIYEKVEAVRSGQNYYSFVKNGKIGLVSIEKQAIVSEPIYTEITEFNDYSGYVSVIKDNKEGIFRQGNMIVPCAYDSIFSLTDAKGWIVYEKDKAGYYINENCKVPCLYKDIEVYDWYSEYTEYGNLSMVEGIIGKTFNGGSDIYRGSDCKRVLKAKASAFDKISVKGSLMLIHKGKKIGFITQRGKIVSPAYDQFIARGNDTFAFMNELGYNKGVLFFYNSEGKLLGKHNVDASKPYTLRKILNQYNVSLSM